MLRAPIPASRLSGLHEQQEREPGTGGSSDSVKGIGGRGPAACRSGQNPIPSHPASLSGRSSVSIRACLFPLPPLFPPVPVPVPDSVAQASSMHGKERKNNLCLLPETDRAALLRMDEWSRTATQPACLALPILSAPRHRHRHRHRHTQPTNILHSHTGAKCLRRGP